jgi:uncharacterized protein YkwD
MGLRLGKGSFNGEYRMNFFAFNKPKQTLLLATATTVAYLAGCGWIDISGGTGERVANENKTGWTTPGFLSGDSLSDGVQTYRTDNSLIYSAQAYQTNGDSLTYGGKSYKTNEDEEMKLYELMMKYREEKGLPRIPISKSLTYVAQIHVIDLSENFSGFDASCNAHSWSGKGNWTACCYTADHANAQGMWDKPRELTSYKGNGYEIAFYITGSGNVQAKAESALNTWKGSSGHNSVIINEGSWKSMNWKAIGIGIYKGYAVTWFGAEQDKEPATSIRTR